MPSKPIVIGCDNAAVELKNVLIGLLKEEGLAFEDVGVNNAEDQTEYPEVARRAADKIIASNYQKEGILVCGTGIGMSITANKFPGIYAAVCHDNYSAERARLSNNSNMICMGARIIGPELAKKVLREWLHLEFKGGRSLSKVEKIVAIEKQNYKAVAAKGSA
jgi:ribose 5-phosphate isomerase B